MLRSVRRAAAFVAVPALATLALVATPTEATAAEPSPGGSAATWLAAQLTGGVVHNDEYAFDDIGLTIDVAFALNALGAAGVPQVAAAVAPHVADDGSGYAEADENDWTDPANPVFIQRGHYAGATAKSLRLAQIAGANVHDFGGIDLQQSLENRVASVAPNNGRIQDDSSFGDYANVIGQSYAAQGLDVAGSTKASAVTDFLLEQQCAPGWFRLDFAERDAADQTCAGDATSVPDTDATAVAVLALVSQSDDAAVASRLALTKSWLQSVQKADGSFGGGPTTEGPNANSTGLAGTALAALGDTAAATKAALWVRAHQAVNAGACAPYAAADAGSIAYDDAALTALAATPIAPATRDKARRATAQAVSVLKWAPAGTGTNVLFTSEYVRAGKTPRVGVNGAAPGDALCATTPGGLKIAATADAKGEAQFPVKLGTKTATTVVTVANAAGVVDTATIKALGDKLLKVKAKKKVVRGKKLPVVVRGLAPAESVTVKIPGTKKSGQANRKGVFKTKLKVKHKAGKVKVKARGQFVDRSGTKAVKILKPSKARR